MRRRFLKLAETLGAREPLALADGLLLLVEGAYAISRTLGSAKGGGGNAPGHVLVSAAEALIAVQVGDR